MAGALFPDPKIALEEAANWPYPIKGYGSYDEMIAANATLPADQKLDYILIVTPNFVHYDPAMKAMKAGIAVFCEKPLCLNLKEANDLVKTARKLNVPFGVAHTYLGPLDQPPQPLHRPQRLAGRRALGGQLLHPGLAGDQARSHRPDTRRSGAWTPSAPAAPAAAATSAPTPSCNSATSPAWMSTQLSAQLETFVAGPQLDDHFTIYCKLSNGGKALVRASQICIGHKNDLGIEVAGTKGTLVWRQEEPESVTIMLPGQPDRVYWRGAVTPGDGFLPKDVPADLMAEPTIPAGPPRSVPRRLRPPASLLRGRRAQVEGRQSLQVRRRQIRQRRRRLDGHRLHRNLRQEQQEEGRLDADAEGGLES